VPLTQEQLREFATGLNLCDSFGVPYTIVMGAHRGVEFKDECGLTKLELLHTKDGSGWVLYKHAEIDG